MSFKSISLALAASSLLLTCPNVAAEQSPALNLKQQVAPTRPEALEIGTALAALLNSCDRVVVKSLNLEIRKTETTTLTDKTTPTRLAAVLSKASYQKKGHCLCIAYPEYAFYRGDKLELELTVHHGETIRVFGGPVAGDFALGEATIKEVVTLLKTSQ